LIFAVGTAAPAPSAGGGDGGAISLAPVVSGVRPASGPATGGTTVTVTGANFAGATAVNFGGVAAGAFTVDSGNEISATAPAGAGTVDVTVVTPYGTSATSSADRFRYGDAVSQTAPTAPPAFSDVPQDHWAAGYIETLAARGIVDGFPDGTFRPDGAVSRAQFVKMLDLTLQLPLSSSPTAFTDVPGSAWFAAYVATAAQTGIAAGTSPTTFSPDAAVTREQMAVLLARALKLTRTAGLRFADGARIDAWALQGVREAAAAGYVQGFPDGTFQPQGTTTRAQAAKVLAMVMSR